MRGRTQLGAQDMMQVFGTVEVGSLVSNEIDQIAWIFKIQGHFLVQVFQYADHANGGGWINRAVFALVIETYISPGYRRAQFLASFGHAFDGLYKLIVNFGLIGISEIQAIGNSNRLSAAANNISCRFAHRHHGAFIWISEHITAVAIGGGRNGFFAA